MIVDLPERGVMRRGVGMRAEGVLGGVVEGIGAMKMGNTRGKRGLLFTTKLLEPRMESFIPRLPSLLDSENLGRECPCWSRLSGFAVELLGCGQATPLFAKGATAWRSCLRRHLWIAAWVMQPTITRASLNKLENRQRTPPPPKDTIQTAAVFHGQTISIRHHPTARGRAALRATQG